MIQSFYLETRMAMFKIQGNSKNYFFGYLKVFNVVFVALTIISTDDIICLMKSLVTDS